MSEPSARSAWSPPGSNQAGRGWIPRAGAPPLGRVLELALFLRVLAALAVEWRVWRDDPARIDLFPDTNYYWLLADVIRRGLPYEVLEWGDIPHFALRTPGYPLFLAACRTLLGDRPLGARLVQAGLGVVTVYLVFRLSRAVLGDGASAHGAGGEGRAWSVPLVAATLTAVHPYFVLMAVILLSETVFVPLMLASLWGLAVLWDRPGGRRPIGARRGSLIALAAGGCGGGAILVRPSWVLFLPLMLIAFVADRFASLGRGGMTASARGAGMFALGFCLAMAPWWIRNARAFGEFVPTALWMGASLYDGIGPTATGASDMTFLGAPDVWPLDELDQDRRLARRAVKWAGGHPGRVLALSAVKLGRYWSPWPNVGGLRSTIVAVACSAVVVPVFFATALGLWFRRRDPRAWILLAGPLLYFCALHLVFASSMRYRVPGEVPAMGLSALGMVAIEGGRIRPGTTPR